MSTTTSPVVQQALARLAQADVRPGASYSPTALMILRWLAFRPGSTAELVTRVQDRPLIDTTSQLMRLRKLGLVKGTRATRWTLSADGRPRSRPDARWWLTAEGREFVEVLDREGIV